MTLLELRRLGVFDLFGDLFATRAAARSLLEDVGLNPARMPGFGEPTIALYWEEVFRQVLAGAPMNGGGDLNGNVKTLLVAALSLHPDNRLLRDLVGDARRGPWRVLCLMASPVDASRMRLEAEYRELRAIAIASPERLSADQSLATRVDDILPELVRADADIVHFAGHGTADGRLVFEDQRGQRAPVSIDALAALMSKLDDLECIMLSSCFSGGYAQSLLPAARHVVGAAQPMGDIYSTAFVSAFYRTLAAGRSVPDSYEIARAGLGLIPGGDPHLMRLLTRENA